MFLAARGRGAVGGVGLVMGCAWRIASLCKTGAVLRFCDHGGAAEIEDVEICRGF